MSHAGLNHDNARTEEQKTLMAKIEEDGVCPFCAEHFKKYHPKPILKETDYWFVTENMNMPLAVTPAIMAGALYISAQVVNRGNPTSR